MIPVTLHMQILPQPPKANVLSYTTKPEAAPTSSAISVSAQQLKQKAQCSLRTVVTDSEGLDG
jgi:hypothetical protein